MTCHRRWCFWSWCQLGPTERLRESMIIDTRCSPRLEHYRCPVVVVRSAELVEREEQRVEIAGAALHLGSQPVVAERLAAHGRLGQAVAEQDQALARRELLCHRLIIEDLADAQRIARTLDDD